MAVFLSILHRESFIIVLIQTQQQNVLPTGLWRNSTLCSLHLQKKNTLWKNSLYCRIEWTEYFTENHSLE